MVDALLLLSFGGPEGPDDVMPFLRRVVAGRNVPDERLLEVAEHYQHFGGRSPINAQNRALLAALGQRLEAEGPDLPIYWGNRNWHPLLEDTAAQMRADGVRSALAIATSAFGSYSGCRQYREDLARVGEGLLLQKLRHFCDHPAFLEAQARRVEDCMVGLSGPPRLVMTAHSIPLSMARSGPYVQQLEAATRWLGERLGLPAELVWQSRSGPPQVPWLEPDVCDFLRQVPDDRPVVLVPLGFVSDHMEVMFDLDVEAREVADSRGLTMVRAGTVGTHPLFVDGLRSMILDHLAGEPGPRVTGMPQWPQPCPADCCPAPVRPARRPSRAR